MPLVWLFPTVVTPAGGIVRGRALRADPDRGDLPFVRTVRSVVFTRELPHADVRVELAGASVAARADAEGFFAVEIDRRARPLPLGPVAVRAFLAARASAAGEGTIHVAPADGVSVVSDIDDTIALSDVRRRLRLLVRALFRPEAAHAPVPGMADLYRRLAAAGVAFHYVSRAPVGFLRRLERFLASHGFPAGALALRHLETHPSDHVAYKGAVIQDIARALPGHRFVLIGDSGEKDPEVFAALRDRLGDRVALALIRRVTREPREHARFRGLSVFDEAGEAEAALRAGRLLSA